MTNTTPNQHLSLQNIDDDDSVNSTKHVRKGNKLLDFSSIPKSETKGLKNKASGQFLSAVRTPRATGPQLVPSLATGPPIFASSNRVGNPMPTCPPATTQELSIIFLENLPKPATKTALPMLSERIENTAQLVYCNTLLLQGEKASDNVVQMKSTLAENERQWLEEMDKNPMKKAHIRWLATRMVEEFIQDGVRDSTKIAEIIALGPVLDREPYRKLLSCLIGGFEDARILDTDLLQGLVQLVQSGSPRCLVSDDLVKIFGILRIRLQGTHRQSSEHSFHLTQSVARVLDVMAEHDVKDLNRVEEHESLSGVLSGLKGSSDPYLMYQACYAFQALQYVPDDETALQAILRHSKGVASGLAKISSLVKLDLDVVIEGLGDLKDVAAGVHDVAMPAYEGLCSVMESGRGVLENLQDGYGSGSRKKRPWYVAIRAAYALVEAGQLKDLNRLINEAPCRRDPLFQWGACQLLGEIASDVIWDTTVRQHAVDLLGELYKNDPEWGQDESVNTWMINIISQLGTSPDRVVATSAQTLLKELMHDQGNTTRLPYPLRSRLPLPTSSPLLTRVQAIPDVEYDLHKLRLQRIEERRRGVYIPPQAKPNLQAGSDTLFPLMEKVQEFLASHRQVFLVLGNSGAGKSTFNLELEYTMWRGYKYHGPIPLYINLPTIDDPAHDLIEKQLQYYNFSESQIQEMKLHREFVLICDGYDESQLKINIFTTNNFNQTWQWKVKMVISCRTQYLGQDYRYRFQPHSTDRYQHVAMDLFEEAVVAAFTREQIQQYVEEYVKELSAVDIVQDELPWTAGEYMDKLIKIPNLMDLVSNPFLLSLSLDALPSVVKSHKDLSTIRITRVQLYDSFVRRWLQVNCARLEQSPLSDAERSDLQLLVEDNFLYHGTYFQKELATAIFIVNEGNPIVKYTPLRDKATWKSAFFAPEGQAKLLRESSTVMRTGAFFRFLHRSLLEYFYSRTIYDPRDYDSDGDNSDDREPTFDFKTCLAQKNIVDEPSILQFLAERVSQNPLFKQRLLDAIEESKADAVEEPIKVAAANAISVLVRGGVSFNGADLRCIKIPGADLSAGQFDSAQFQGADLTGVNFSKSWLRQVDMSDAHMEGVRFGELPYVGMDQRVRSCTISPDGKMLGAGLENGIVYIYETSTWTRMHRLEGHTFIVRSVVFSPDNQRLASGSYDKTARLWDTTSGEELLVMKGHGDYVSSVSISPCGNRIASSGVDETIRLWDAQTGESLFILEGHGNSVISVKYSPDGRQLVSGGYDGKIRFWNAETGEPGVVLSPSFGGVICLSYSPDGRWIAAGHQRGQLQLWDAVSLEPGPVLAGHPDIVTGVDFSPEGQWIASSSDDKTVRIWDVSTSTLVTVLTGHNNYVSCVAFSPDGVQIASAGDDWKVRLWEVGSSWSSLDPQDGGRVEGLAYTPDGRTVLSHDKGGTFRQSDAATGTSAPIPYKIPMQTEVTSRANALDGSQLAFGYHDGSICLWNCQTGTAGPVLEGHLHEIKKLFYSPCCRWIVSVDESNTVQLWDLGDMESQHLVLDIDEDSEGDVRDVAFSSTG
ncbi:hypothetical protein BGW39_001016, partial [Mortierella sp. 14UC]